MTRFTIGRKLALGFGVLLLLFVIAGLITDGSIRGVDDDLSHLARVEEPVNEAAHEMEINTIGAGLAVIRYLDTGEPKARERFRDDVGDFQRFEARYGAANPAYRELGERVEGLFDEYRRMGENLMDEKDRQDALFEQVNEGFDEVDRILDEELQARLDAEGTDGAAKEQSLANLETAAGEVGTWFGVYLRDPTTENRARIFDNVEDFRAEVSRVESLDLTPEERVRAGRLDGRFEETIGVLEESLAVNENLRDGSERFIGQRNELDEVLNEQLQPVARRKLETAQDEARDAAANLRELEVILLVAGLLLGGGASYLIRRNIVKPLGTLTEETRRIARGDLDTPIEVESRDEVADLAVVFNEMARQRRRSEEKVRRLYAVLEKRVEDRTGDLRESEERYRAVIEQAVEGIYIVDPETARFQESNTSYRRMIGYSEEELLGMTLHDVVMHPREEVEQVIRRAMEERALSLEGRVHRRKDGTLMEVDVGMTAISRGGREWLCVIVHDVTGRREAERRLVEAERRFRALVEQMPVMVYTEDAETQATLYDSPQVETILGYPQETYRTDPHYWEKILHPEDRARVMAEGHKAIEAGRFSLEYRCITSDGRVRWVLDEAVLVREEERGGAGVWQGVISDVTDRKVLEEQLTHQAFHDTLTGLPNRALFANRLKHALARVGREDNMVAVLFLDLDRFKVVNDSLGHAAGDELLTQVAARLHSSLRIGDTLARLGGDEFAVLLENASWEGDATTVAAGVIEALRMPFTIEGHEVAASTSVGIAIGKTSSSADTMLRNADLAMYGAKRRGRSGYEIFDPEMDARARGRLRLENDLRRAIERDEFVVHYQPVYSVDTGELHSFEALVRWEHPERGLASPAEFIPLAEETGLIIPLGRWVLEEVCAQAKAWRSLYYREGREMTVAVNVSGVQLESEGFVDVVEATLRESGLPRNYLTLEITESVLMDDVEATLKPLVRLKELGVKFAVDDFGTGYSSLAYLRRFPIDFLKVDRSFVDGLSMDDSGAIVETMISLSRALGLRVIAEGIETREQLDYLEYLDCDLGQGFLFSRPLRAADAAGILASAHAQA